MERLYQDALKAHYMTPVGLNRHICVSHQSEGYNASCGDEISVFMQLSDQGVITDISFETDSCAICTASASLLCEISNGLNLQTLTDYYHYLKSTLNLQPNKHSVNIKSSKLDCLFPVSAHPSRVNCALLPWQTAIETFHSPITEQSTANYHA